MENCQVTRKLIMMVTAARNKKEPLHHILLCGQPEMGKVTLSRLIASEVGVDCKVLSGDKIENGGDFAAILTNIRAGDFLIIEQIEAMRKPLLEALIQAAEDFNIEIITGKGPARRPITLNIPHFTVVGTTSKPSQVDKRISGLFFIFNFAPYTIDEIKMVIRQATERQKITISEEVTDFLAEHCDKCPGEALRALKKVRDYATAYSDGVLNSKIAREVLTEFSINGNPPIFERLSIPDDVKMFVWQRDGGRCVKCGSQENLEYDHIIPVSKGGSNSARNIQLLCENCNRSKGGNIS